MNGLDTILTKIKNETKAVADQIIQAAHFEADGIKNAAAEQVAIESEKIIKSARFKAERIELNQKSSCEAVANKAVLQAKSDVIRNWTDMAKNHFEHLDTPKYFENITKLIVKVFDEHKTQKCEIMFNENDLKRIPTDFIRNINEQYNLSLELSNNTANITSGFVIAFGDIYENCSFDALFEEKKDEICDELYKLINA